MARGQVSVEYLVVTGTSLFILSIIIFGIMSNYNSVKRQFQMEQGRYLIDEICETANYVYSYSPGSSVSVRLTVPDLNPQYSYIDGRLINLRIGDSDINDKCAVEIKGTLPSDPGDYHAVFIKRDGYVELKFS